MIEGGILPTAGVMASRTDRAELPVMGVIGGVTSHALPRRTLEHTIRVTIFARHTRMRTREREARAAVVEIHILPRGRVVAGTAVGSELTVVLVIRRVTGKTIGRRSLESSVGMAGGAGGSLVGAHQFESCLAVIEMHVLPIEGVMALRTVHPHLPLMDIRVTGHTSGGCAFERQIIMAFQTGNVYMAAHQRKRSFRMIERDILPGGCLMTGSAVRPQHALMRVVLSVTGETIGGGSLEEIVLMTRPAGNIRMGGGQFERRTVVVEMRWRPALRRMAGGAVFPQHPFMRVVVQMTGGAVLSLHSEVGKAVTATMTIHTRRFSMFTRQFELKSVMVEAGHHAVVTVMTVQARLAIGKDMIHHESLVALTVT